MPLIPISPHHPHVICAYCPDGPADGHARGEHAGALRERPNTPRVISSNIFGEETPFLNLPLG